MPPPFLRPPLFPPLLPRHPLALRHAHPLLPRRLPPALQDAPDSLGADMEAVRKDRRRERMRVHLVQVPERVHRLARELARGRPALGEALLHRVAVRRVLARGRAELGLRGVRPVRARTCVRPVCLWVSACATVLVLVAFCERFGPVLLGAVVGLHERLGCGVGAGFPLFACEMGDGRVEVYEGVTGGGFWRDDGAKRGS
ncbi:hypothetical protein GSI_14818 [Ganoderma sinense ZZ0214-1]|uniref:Uncharacterized protein n=1 Tax=Ganoderma sinense ZZ0214-1 TaxID=1077348 RepID=A0A2G8RPS7_9APHY|nr:hypothetical protein GSI_14818 [Ganoderma sinense ZZ0214-1]